MFVRAALSLVRVGVVAQRSATTSIPVIGQIPLNKFHVGID